MDDINKLIEILKNFEQEHRDLDEILIRLQEKNTVDFLQIQRLKKRKLVLKDILSFILGILDILLRFLSIFSSTCFISFEKKTNKALVYTPDKISLFV